MADLTPLPSADNKPSAPPLDAMTAPQDASPLDNPAPPEVDASASSSDTAPVRSPRSGGLPQPLRTIGVSSSEQLSSAISGAVAGDHIVLASGTYDAFTISRNGTQPNPIVIRAANTWGAKVGGDINMDGNHAWVVGIDVISGGKVVITGAGNRISSSRLRSQGKSIEVKAAARSAVVDHNEIVSQATPSSVAWFGIMVRPDSIQGDQHTHHVYRNHLHGAPPDDATGDDNGAIGVKAENDRVNYAIPTVVEYNLVADWYGDSEVLMAKGSDVTFQFNTGINIREFDNRHGENNKWIANWCENTQGIRIQDRNNQVIGNRCDVRIMGGDVTPSQFDMDGGPPNHPASWDTFAAGNIGTLKVGDTFTPTKFPAIGTVIEAHKGAVQRVLEESTTIRPTTSRTIPAAFRLATSDVGPSAPTAPRW